MLSYLLKGPSTPSSSHAAQKITKPKPVKVASSSNNTNRPSSLFVQTMLKRSHSAHSTLDIIGKDWLNSPRPTKTLKRKESYDRFIPHRQSMNLASSQFNLANKKETVHLGQDSKDYNEQVAKACGLATDARILAFQPRPPQDGNKTDAVTRKSQDTTRLVRQRSNVEDDTPRRHIVSTPEKILDAPYMTDDYYLNLLDWSCQNVVAVALDRVVYLWNADNGEIQSLNYQDQDLVTSLSWSADGAYLALGVETGNVQIWDVKQNSKLRTMKGRSSLVGAMSWNKFLVSSGAKDGSIWHHDVRIAKHKTAELLGHEDRVCGMRWRSDGQLLASGGNDNTVNIWDIRSSKPKFSKRNHVGAIKALAWCPWNLNLLATGGGREDKHIHFWNTTTTGRVNSIFTGAQVTSLHWSKHYKEIVSTHGYPKNQLSVWSYPQLNKLADIPGHDSRILHSALSPDGQVVATAAADENLKFWRIFEHDGSKELLLPRQRTDQTALLRRTTSLR
ncbi:WD40 repeat-like protein [Hesseltinella vesiculosa]|uniref:WD40 repeat-like protein n=1 Tax=Hesseltinella vesiculosa TaxID=101127 RepID=A0A1X2GC72_9FUNG|nr:WD40 repeat-like protein [Hesseltinella vesiculosa]